MRPLKRIIVFYLINLILFALNKLVFNGIIFKDFLNWGFLLIPLVSIFAGTAMGFLIFLFVNNDSKVNQIYTIGLAISTLFWNVYLSSIFFSNWKHKQNFGNIESNNSLLKDYSGFDVRVREKTIAFQELEKKYKNPNDIILGSIESKKKDTIILGLPDSIFFVKFFYSRKENDTMLTSLFSIYKDSVHCYYFDRPISEVKLKELNDNFKKIKKRVKADVESLPDSIIEKIDDDILENLDSNNN